MTRASTHAASIDSDALLTTILEFGRLRRVYLDEELASDGSFTILLTLYARRDEVDGATIASLVEALDGPLSTALYILERMVDWGYVEMIGERGRERYRLSVSAERRVEAYAADCASRLEDLVRTHGR